ncbi:Serine carboxypeptidase-like 45 [Bienertia sinuspersici]
MESNIEEIDGVLECLFRKMASYHTRSLSFPSKAHPFVEQFDEQLSRLRSSQAASTSSSSLNQTLSDLKDLYCTVDELLQLPINQQVVSQNVHSKWTEQVLDGSLRLLDICSTSRDVLVQSKEGLQDIQSVLRRRCSGELNINNEIAQYLNTRKSSKKMIKKSLKNIKESQQTTCDNAVESMLKDVEAITIDIFKSVLSYIGGARLESQKTKWSLVNKLMNQGSNTEAKSTNSKFDVVEATLEPIIKNKYGIILLQVENMRCQMTKLEFEIQSLDESLDSLFRHLVKTRATILNILSN